MNRRSFFKNLALSKDPIDIPQKAQINALEKFQGTWNKETRLHLLRRTMFGCTPAEYNSVETKSLDEILDILFAGITLPEEPLAYTNSGSITAGNPWVSAAYESGSEPQRLTFLQSWQINIMLKQPMRIHDKMVLFWQNHFATGATVVKDARYMYKQTTLLYQQSLGNAKDLVRYMLFDLAMSRYLNNNTNTKSNPNENLARELQELFTIGKGPEIAPGNYTHYTEQDVKAAGRVISGWADNQSKLSLVFTPNNHDTQPKQFSSAYQNTIIKSTANTENSAKTEVDDLLSMIFKQEQTSLYLVRKLYRYFVDYVIDDSVENYIIKPLAEQFRAANFEVKPILRTLLSSTHFYSNTVRNCFIKTPADLIIGTARFFHPEGLYPEELNLMHWANRTLRRLMGNMGLDLMNPPNVAGIPAYYQEPSFHELWINADTLQKRIKFTNDLSIDHLQLDEMDYTKGPLIDVIQFAKDSGDPTDPTVIINYWCDWLFSMPISETVKNQVKDFLTAGSPDYEWTVKWNLYIADESNTPQDAAIVSAVEKPLRNLIKYLLAMAEYQLI